MLALALEAAAHYGVACSSPSKLATWRCSLRWWARLTPAPAWKRRLVKDFNRKTNLAEDLDRLVLGGANGRPEYQGVLAALAGSDPKGAHAVVTDLLSIAGISAVGGRSVGEIADRFLEQAALGASARLPQDVRSLIERFLAVSGDPDSTAVELRALADDAKLDLGATLDAMESRTGFFAARGLDVGALQVRDRIRPRLRLLHRVCLRNHRRHAGAAGCRWPL